MSVDNPNTKGAVAELKVATAAVALGIPVLRPMTERGRYDLAFDVGSRLIRIQCKWAAARRETVFVNLRSSYLTKTREVQTEYRAHEIDAVAAYCAKLERIYLLPIELVKDRWAITLASSSAVNVQRYTGRPITSFLGL